MPPPNHIEIHQTLEKVDLAAYKKNMLKVARSKFFAKGKQMDTDSLISRRMVGDGSL